MVKKHKKKGAARKRYQPGLQLVFLHLWGKELNPDKITQVLGIKPDWLRRRGVEKGPNGKVIRDRNGKLRKSAFGRWFIESHVHENSGIVSRIEDILKQIRPKKRQLRRILKETRAELTIVVEPPRDLATYSYILPASLLNEFTSLGIDIEITVDIPQEWDKFWRYVEKMHKKEKIPKMLSKKS